MMTAWWADDQTMMMTMMTTMTVTMTTKRC
jgi:hypothetical protein